MTATESNLAIPTMETDLHGRPLVSDVNAWLPPDVWNTDHLRIDFRPNQTMMFHTVPGVGQVMRERNPRLVPITTGSFGQTASASSDIAAASLGVSDTAWQAFTASVRSMQSSTSGVGYTSSSSGEPADPQSSYQPGNGRGTYNTPTRPISSTIQGNADGYPMSGGRHDTLPGPAAHGPVFGLSHMSGPLAPPPPPPPPPPPRRLPDPHLQQARSNTDQHNRQSGPVWNNQRASGQTHRQQQQQQQQAALPRAAQASGSGWQSSGYQQQQSLSSAAHPVSYELLGGVSALVDATSRTSSWQSNRSPVTAVQQDPAPTEDAPNGPTSVYPVFGNSTAASDMSDDPDMAAELESLLRGWGDPHGATAAATGDGNDDEDGSNDDEEDDDGFGHVFAQLAGAARSAATAHSGDSTSQHTDPSSSQAGTAVAARFVAQQVLQEADVDSEDADEWMLDLAIARSLQDANGTAAGTAADTTSPAGGQAAVVPAAVSGSTRLTATASRTSADASSSMTTQASAAEGWRAHRQEQVQHPQATSGAPAQLPPRATARSSAMSHIGATADSAVAVTSSDNARDALGSSSSAATAARLLFSTLPLWPPSAGQLPGSISSRSSSAGSLGSGSDAGSSTISSSNSSSRHWSRSQRPPRFGAHREIVPSEQRPFPAVTVFDMQPTRRQEGGIRAVASSNAGLAQGAAAGTSAYSNTAAAGEQLDPQQQLFASIMLEHSRRQGIGATAAAAAASHTSGVHSSGPVSQQPQEFLRRRQEARRRWVENSARDRQPINAAGSHGHAQPSNHPAFGRAGHMPVPPIPSQAALADSPTAVDHPSRMFADFFATMSSLRSATDRQGRMDTVPAPGDGAAAPGALWDALTTARGTAGPPARVSDLMNVSDPASAVRMVRTLMDEWDRLMNRTDAALDFSAMEGGFGLFGDMSYEQLVTLEDVKVTTPEAVLQRMQRITYIQLDSAPEADRWVFEVHMCMFLVVCLQGSAQLRDATMLPKYLLSLEGSCVLMSQCSLGSGCATHCAAAFAALASITCFFDTFLLPLVQCPVRCLPVQLQVW